MPDINHSEITSLRVKARHEKIKCLKESQQIPALITLKTKEVDVNDVRPGLDVVFCVDISGSMSGNKL